MREQVSNQVERLTGKKKLYDPDEGVLIIEGVEYDVLALWGHVEALEHALDASSEVSEGKLEAYWTANKGELHKVYLAEDVEPLLDQLLSLLGQCEYGSQGDGVCPVCVEDLFYGHSDDCGLAAALRK